MTKRFTSQPLNTILEPVERPESPVPGQEYRQVGVRLWGGGAYEREVLDGSQTKYKSLSRVETDDIIVNKIWARNGTVAVIPENLAGCFVSGEFPTFTPVRSKLDLRWFHWFTKTPMLWDQCDEKSRGTSGKNRIRPERFLEILLPLPPLTEQSRIVARIEELAAKIEEARTLRTGALEQTKALLFSASNHFFAPDDAHADRLEAFTTRITKGESPEWQGFSYQETGPLFIRSENVLWGTLNRSKKVCVPDQFHQKLNRSQLRPGDVLINLVGASIGRSCVVPDDIGQANVNQAVAVISPDPKRLDDNYLMRYLLSPITQDMIHGGKVETARPNISLGDLRDLLIPVPSLDEQRRIVAYLDNLQAKVDAVRKMQEETAKEFNALMPSILSRAFSGEL